MQVSLLPLHPQRVHIPLLSGARRRAHRSCWYQSSSLRLAPRDDPLRVSLQMVAAESHPRWTPDPVPREECFPVFLKWLQDNDVKSDAVTIEKFEVGGYGLKAVQDIKAEELFITIPRKLMLTTETARESSLGPLIKKDRILQVMANVSLALHVLCEKYTSNSFWAPYINIFPGTYTTPLYFEEGEMLHLQGSLNFSDVLNQYKSIARQYAYFYKLFQTQPEATGLPLKECFTFDEYRWAVSTVMTRQNQVPTSDGRHLITALIPMWDMCNHSNGEFSTEFNLGSDSAECLAMREFPTDSQVYIFYGMRSNAEFLIHNGFVYPENVHDRVNIKLGVSKNDSLFAMKAEVLSRAGIHASTTFQVHCGKDPIPPELLVFLRVFTMVEGDLRELLTSEHQSAFLSCLGRLDCMVTQEQETKAWAFLETRLSLLIRSYRTSIKDVETELQAPDMTYHTRAALQLKLAEMQILSNAAEYAKTQRDKIPQLIEEKILQLAAEVALTVKVSDDLDGEFVEEVLELSEDEEELGTDQKADTHAEGTDLEVSKDGNAAVSRVEESKSPEKDSGLESSSERESVDGDAIKVNGATVEANGEALISEKELKN
ncbi:SETD3 [Branchiostoma lanceolatum]|uniref:protein-histidine N-methyltransferase n=1 Tax=Branchiostoma lanceolatum TaxID=7740 RepID=A0A8K0EQ27_BRALA|nr:SETD3 [Branchiostoma lanceolatum]